MIYQDDQWSNMDGFETEKKKMLSWNNSFRSHSNTIRKYDPEDHWNIYTKMHYAATNKTLILLEYLDFRQASSADQ